MRTISHITLFTHDVPGLTEFYRVMLGGEPVHRDQHISIFRSGGFSLLIHAIREEGEAGLPFDDHFSFHVSNAEEACDGLRAQGIAFEREPDTYSWGKSAYLRDPDGRLLEIHEKKEMQ